MSDKPKHKNPRVPNQKRFQKQAPVLSPEEQAKALAAKEAALLAAKQEAERIRLYGEAVPKMSHRQLQAELDKTVKREYAGRPPQPQAGLTIAFATVLGAVLRNTKTAERGLRPDQINPSGKIHSYPL